MIAPGFFHARYSLATKTQRSGSFDLTVFVEGKMKEAKIKNWSYKLSEDEVEYRIFGRSGAFGINKDVFSSLPKEENLWLLSSSYMLAFLNQDQPRFADVKKISSLYTSRNNWVAGGDVFFNTLWHPYSVSQRLLVLIAALSISNESDAIASLEKETWFHMAFLNDHVETDLGYNHLLKNYYAMIMVYLYQGVVRRDLLKKYMWCLAGQIDESGMHRELCPMYHHMVASDLLILSRVLSENGIESELQKEMDFILKRMESAAKVVTFSSGEPALFGDSWLNECKVLELFSDSLRGFGLESSGGYHKLTSASHELILDAGDCGPDDNPGHAHDDYLSVELMSNGLKLINDYGVSTYQASEERNYCRSDSFHNGPRYKGLNGLEAWGAFRVGRRSKAFSKVISVFPDTISVLAKLQPYEKKEAWVYRLALLGPRSDVLICDYWPKSGQCSPNEVAFSLTCDDICLSEGTIDLPCGLKAGIRIPEESSISDTIIYREYGASIVAKKLQVSLMDSDAAHYSYFYLSNEEIDDEYFYKLLKSVLNILNKEAL